MYEGIIYQGITKPVNALVQPNSRILSKAMGKADSLEAELNASNQGWAMVLKKPMTGILAKSMMGTNTTSKKITKDA